MIPPFLQNKARLTVGSPVENHLPRIEDFFSRPPEDDQEAKRIAQELIILQASNEDYEQTIKKGMFFIDDVEITSERSMKIFMQEITAYNAQELLIEGLSFDSVEFTNETWKAFIEEIKTSEWLTTLEFCGRGITSEQLSMLADPEIKKRIKKINFISIGELSVEQVEAISKFFIDNECLREFQLRDSTLDFPGGKIFSEKLPLCKNLHTIKLDESYISNCHLVSQAISRLPVLEKLSLKGAIHNSQHDYSLAMQNPHLRKLQLNKNSYRCTTIIWKFFQAIPPALEEVDLRGCEIAGNVLHAAIHNMERLFVGRKELMLIFYDDDIPFRDPKIQSRINAEKPTGFVRFDLRDNPLQSIRQFINCGGGELPSEEYIQSTSSPLIFRQGQSDSFFPRGVSIGRPDAPLAQTIEPSMWQIASSALERKTAARKQQQEEQNFLRAKQNFLHKHCDKILTPVLLTPKVYEDAVNFVVPHDEEFTAHLQLGAFMAAIVRSFNVRKGKVPGDGSCLLNSIRALMDSEFLSNPENKEVSPTAKKMREDLVEALRARGDLQFYLQNEDVLIADGRVKDWFAFEVDKDARALAANEEIIDEIKSNLGETLWTKYCDKISQSTSWLGNIEIGVLSEMYQRTIIILDSSNKHAYTIAADGKLQVPDHLIYGQDFNGKPPFYIFRDSFHFSPLLPENDQPIEIDRKRKAELQPEDETLEIKKVRPLFIEEVD